VSSTIEFFYDTMPPIATLKGLSYTTSIATNHFILTSDEYITNMFDIYTIDSTGTRRDYPYQVVNSNYYIKDFFFNDYPLGPVSFYASIMDDVGNTIELEPLTLEIFRSEKLTCETNDRYANNITVNSREAFTIILNDEGSK
jgi:hypothetical protein